MNIESTAPRRTRRGALTTLAAGLAAASVFTLIPVSPAGAAVQAPQNVVGVVNSATEVRVQWTAPAAGDEPTYYIVTVDGPDTDTDGGGVDTDTDFEEALVPATARSFTFGSLRPNTTYDLDVCANDGVTEACTDGLDVTTPLVPPTTPPPAAGPYAPFYTVDAFIRENYQDWLDRAPRFDELTFWRDALNGGTTKVEFLESLRTDPYVDGVEEQVIRLYIAYYLRNPEFAGFDYWRDVRRGDRRSIRGVSDFMSRAPEFQRRYGTLDDAEFVTLVYRNVLGRSPEAAGFAYWTRQLQTGSMSRGGMMLGFSTSPEFDAKTNDAVLSTEIYGDMLDRVPTLAEYDAWTRVPDADLPDLIYSTIMASAEYAGTIDTGLGS